MSVSSARHGVGVLFVFLSVTQLIAVLVRVKHKTSVFPDPTVGWYAAGILTTGFFAVTILTQPLIPLDEERYINWYVVLLVPFFHTMCRVLICPHFPFCVSNLYT